MCATFASPALPALQSGASSDAASGVPELRLCLVNQPPSTAMVRCQAISRRHLDDAVGRGGAVATTRAWTGPMWKDKEVEKF